MKRDSLISIHAAASLLGVSEQALRQWTDTGKIKAFITPGGHRRYSPAELKHFASTNQKMLGIKDLVEKLEDALPVLRKTATSYLQTTSWKGKLDKETQENLASLGRRLLNIIIHGVSEPTEHKETLNSVREVGSSMGRILAKQGLPLTDAVQTFIQHRDPMAEVVTELLKKRKGIDRRVVEAIPFVNNVMDQALVSFVTAHQENRNSTSHTNHH